MITIPLPFDILATIHPTGVYVSTPATWVENDSQAAGLRSLLQVVGKALESGADVPALRSMIVPTIKALKENRIGMV
jgi:hypothetical protein